jgi:hypothetical protein
MMKCQNVNISNGMAKKIQVLYILVRELMTLMSDDSSLLVATEVMIFIIVPSNAVRKSPCHCQLLTDGLTG